MVRDLDFNSLGNRSHWKMKGKEWHVIYVLEEHWM